VREKFLITSCLLSIFNTLGLSHVNYCNSTWCTANYSLISCLQTFCNKILRIIFHRNKRVHVDDLYKKYGILKIVDRYKFEVCCFVYKYFNNILSACFHKSFQANSEICFRHTRQSDQLRVPFVAKTICRQSIAFKGTQLWNEFPSDLKSCRNFKNFKLKLKLHFLNNY